MKGARALPTPHSPPTLLPAPSAGPRIVKSDRADAAPQVGFLRAMSDAGLKPTVVYHNLTPAELYEKV